MIFVKLINDFIHTERILIPNGHLETTKNIS